VFRSIEFPIENRPGLEDQRIEDVLGALRRFGAPDLPLSSDRVKDDMRTRLDIAKWLSDWHLIVFLGTTQIFSDVSELFRFSAFV
jgi:nuclear protein localization family protein 4